MGSFTLHKAERLSKKKPIKELFSKGSSFYLYPFKIIYLKETDSSVDINRVIISVSNRTFKKAVDRNLIKRRVREAYRLQKEIIAEKPEKVMIGIIYTSKTILPFQEIKENLFLVLKKIKNL